MVPLSQWKVWVAKYVHAIRKAIRSLFADVVTNTVPYLYNYNTMTSMLDSLITYITGVQEPIDVCGLFNINTPLTQAHHQPLYWH